jgi:3-phytase
MEKKSQNPYLVLIGCISTLLNLAACVSQSPKESVNSTTTLTNRNTFLVPLNTSADEPFTGGISSLYFSKFHKGDLIAIVDRGPNANVLINEPDQLPNRRPFAQPSFSPYIVQLRFSKSENSDGKSKLLIARKVALKGPDGKPLSGLPNRNQDENPVDLYGKYIRHDPNGLDPEGVVVTRDGTFWVSEEYGPSLVQFDSTGKWLGRYTPQGGIVPGMNKTHDSLPSIYATRRLNSGFEALANDGNTLYLFLQSPLTVGGRNLRILAFDAISKKTVGEYIYVLSDAANNKIGDAVFVGNSRILLLEHGKLLKPNLTVKLLREINLSGATNLMSHPTSKDPKFNVDSASLDELKKQGINPVAAKTISDNLTLDMEYTMKPEGLAYDESAGKIYIANDNDFGLLGGIDPKTNKAELGAQKSFIEDYRVKISPQ